MADWEAALKAVGGLTAIGVLIDLAMYKAEKKKLQDWLETWWLRFTDVRWSNFGRKEADLAVQILDRWAGPRLWSWKRWRFSVIVSLSVFVVMFLWVWLQVTWHGDSIDFVEGNSSTIRLIFVDIYYLAATTVAFALSLTVTRFIAKYAARVSNSAILCAMSFSVLLALHLALFWFWGPVLHTYLEPIPLALLDWLADDGRSLKAILDEVLGGGLFIATYYWPAPFIKYSGAGISDILEAQSIGMDFCANGLRILFALVFLSSFVFRPLIQEPVSRLWYGAMNSGKPFFTMLFGAIGTLVAVGQALSK